MHISNIRVMNVHNMKVATIENKHKLQKQLTVKEKVRHI